MKAGETGNDVTQKGTTTYGDTDTIITNSDKNTASSHTVTIEANDKDDKVEVTLKDVNIDTSSRNKAAVSVTGSGNTTIKLDGDNALKSDSSRSGIYGSGSLTITGGENDSLTAQGGSGENGGDGISSDSLTISGGTVTTKGGSGDDGGSGVLIYSNGSLTVSSGTVTANGGDSKDGYGGDGIRSGGVTISGGTVTATGGKSGSGDYRNGGNGISSSGSLSISGGTVTATAGSSSGSYGRDGITTSSSLTISGGTVTANGGSGISSSDIELSGSLELTAKAGSPNGKALSRAGHELNLDDIKEKLDPGAKVTAINANGDSKQVSIPRPVEPEGPVIPEESSSSSDGGSATPSAPASPLPGLTVTDKDGQRISYTSIRGNNVLSLRVGRLTASFRISPAALRQLRAEGIDTITFQTILCSTTLSVDELLAMGGEDAEAVLTHRFTDSSLTVG